MDHSGFIFWIVDGQGCISMFLWSEMEECLQFMGNNIVEGFKKYFEGPENMPVWEDGAWVPKKELIYLGKK
ncbi:11367_t:CDS:1, partial [Paraglomus occultum]